MFVKTYILKGGRTRLILLLVAGFFISVTQIYGSVPPRVSVIDALPLRCKSEGKAEPLFYSAQQTNICKMTYTENTCLKGNNSTQQTTPNSATTVNTFNDRTLIGFKSQTTQNQRNKKHQVVAENNNNENNNNNNQENRYLNCLLEAFTDFIKVEASGALPHYGIDEFKKKVEYAQFLFKKDRKQLATSQIVKNL